MGALQNAINQTAILSGAAFAKQRSDAKNAAELARETVKNMKGEEFVEKGLDAKSSTYLHQLESTGSIRDLKKYTKGMSDYASGKYDAKMKAKLSEKKALNEAYNEPPDYVPSSPEEYKAMEEGRIEGEYNDLLMDKLQKMQQNNQNSEMKKALKQYQYNLARSKRGG